MLKVINEQKGNVKKDIPFETLKLTNRKSDKIKNNK